MRISPRLRTCLPWLLPVLLFGVGWLFLLKPHWTRDWSESAHLTAATLVGALWGGAALSLGVWISDLNHERGVRERVEQRKKILDSILRGQFAAVLRSLLSISDAVLLYARYGGHPTNKPIHFNYTSKMPPKFLFSDAILADMYLLREPHVALILDFHVGVENTRGELGFWSDQTESKISLPISIFFLNQLKENFELALALSEAMWPNELLVEKGRSVLLKDRLTDELAKVQQVLRPN